MFISIHRNLPLPLYLPIFNLCTYLSTHWSILHLSTYLFINHILHPIYLPIYPPIYLFPTPPLIHLSTNPYKYILTQIIHSFPWQRGWQDADLGAPKKASRQSPAGWRPLPAVRGVGGHHAQASQPLAQSRGAGGIRPLHPAGESWRRWVGSSCLLSVAADINSYQRSTKVVNYFLL